MAFQSSLFVCVVLLLVFTIISTNGLQCHICGQFNDGVGSITPCLNYTETNAHLHLKECPRKTDKFCVVSMWKLFSRSFLITRHGQHKSTFSIITFFLCICHQKIAFCFLFAGRKTLWRCGEVFFCLWGFLSGRPAIYHSAWSVLQNVKGSRKAIKMPSLVFIISQKILSERRQLKFLLHLMQMTESKLQIGL